MPRPGPRARIYSEARNELQQGKKLFCNCSNVYEIRSDFLAGKEGAKSKLHDPWARCGHMVWMALNLKRDKDKKRVTLNPFIMFFLGGH